MEEAWEMALRADAALLDVVVHDTTAVEGWKREEWIRGEKSR